MPTTDELHALVADAVEGAVMGENISSLLPGRVEREVISALRLAGVAGAVAEARLDGRGVVVRVRLPPAPQRVREIVLPIR